MKRTDTLQMIEEATKLDYHSASERLLVTGPCFAAICDMRERSVDLTWTYVWPTGMCFSETGDRVFILKFDLSRRTVLEIDFPHNSGRSNFY